MNLGLLRNILSPVLLILIASYSYGQVFCPPNLNFEQGNFSNWQLDTGRCCPINTFTSGPLTNRHTIVTGAGVDPYGGFPIVAPSGGSYSLKLGNNINGKEAEGARYKVHVPSAPGDYILIYRYAVVLENPNHTQAQQPRFTVTATDSADNFVLPCNDLSYVASSSLPGFVLSPISGTAPVFYKEWTTATLNLKGYNGRTIYVNFASGDCSQGGHFGYGYVDMNCGFFQIQATICNGAPVATLNGPGGYQSYKWYSSGFTTLLASTQTVVVPVPAIPTDYAIVVTPYTGYGCPDTFFTTVNPLNPSSFITATACADTSICNGKAAKLYANVTGNGPFTYEWTPSTNLNCTICSTPNSTTTLDRKYYVSVKDVYGCESKDSVEISILTTPTANAGINIAKCDNEIIQLSGTVTNATSVNWSPSANLINANTTTPTLINSVTGTYTLTAVNGVCSSSDGVNVTAYIPPVANAGRDTVLCRDALYTMQGSATGTVNSRTWFPNTGLSNPGIFNPVLTVSQAMTYYLRAANAACADTDTVRIEIYQTPVMSVNNDTAVCPGKQVQLLGTSGNATGFYWYPLTGLINSNTLTPTHTGSIAGSYMLIGYNLNCNDTAEVEISFLPKPEANAGNDTVLCKNDKIQLNGTYTGTANLFKWYPATGLNNPLLQKPQLNVTQSLPYFFIASNDKCSDTDEVVITYLPVEVKAMFDTTVCQGEKMILHSTGSGGTNFLWWPQNNSMGNHVNANTEITVMQGETYYISLLSSTGKCSDTDTVVVKMKPIPEVNAGNDIVLCETDTVQLKATGSAGKYLWSPTTGLSDPKALNPFIHIKAGAAYALTITLPNGCAASDTISIGLAAAPEFKVVPLSAKACRDELIYLFAGGGNNFKWNPSNGLTDDTIQSPVLKVNKTETYQVRIVDFCGRDTVLSVKVDMLPTPDVDVTKSSDIDCINKDVTLTASGAENYLWYPLDYAISGMTNMVLVKPDKNTKYTVRGTNREGCSDSAVIEVQYQQPKFISPNAFTPNGDGANDCYNLMLPLHPTSYEFMIFNRWGNKVFSTTNFSDCWDGTYNGVQQPEGVYVYYYKLTSDDCGEVNSKGNVTLVR